GSDAIAALRGDRVDTSAIAVLDAEPTGAALIVVDPRGENQIAIGPGANGAVLAAHVRASLAAALPTADVVLVSTEIPLAAVAAAIEASAAAGVTCILNPAPVIPGLPELLSFRPMLTPNELELRALVSGLVGASTSAAGDGVPAHLNALGERTRAPVIVTLGGEGCAVRLPGGELRRIPAHPVADVVDTPGAGDTFNGVFAARLAMGGTLAIALETAIVAASLSVTAIGARAGMPTAAAIDRAIHPMSSRNWTGSNVSSTIGYRSESHTEGCHGFSQQHHHQRRQLQALPLPPLSAGNRIRLELHRVAWWELRVHHVRRPPGVPPGIPDAPDHAGRHRRGRVHRARAGHALQSRPVARRPERLRRLPPRRDRGRARGHGAAAKERPRTAHQHRPQVLVGDQLLRNRAAPRGLVSDHDRHGELARQADH